MSGAPPPAAPGGGARARAAALSAAGALGVRTRVGPEFGDRGGGAGRARVRSLWPPVSVPHALGVDRLGLRFAHPLGLAAGFDKNGDHLDALGALGFSHVELGTVTPRPQPGNPRPRMFRVAGRAALVNRMGFNNLGVDHLVERLARSRYAGVRGVSIGKNFDTPLESAAADYVACLRKVHAHADYVAINVSSPNTARLRELQERDGLQRIVDALFEARRQLAQGDGRRVPLLVKIAPDFNEQELSTVAATLRALGIDGVIATNTSTDRSLVGEAWPAGQQGGLSGAPLHALAVRTVAQLRAALGAGFPIVGVGGIVDAPRALATLRAGADLLQIYTGFAYRGPPLVREILAALADGKRDAQACGPRAGA